MSITSVSVWLVLLWEVPGVVLGGDAHGVGRMISPIAGGLGGGVLVRWGGTAS